MELLPEILDIIFSLLDDHADISACRLTCRLFAPLAQRYLITRVVVAKRTHELIRFHQIVAHPYYSKCITDLVLDSSNFLNVDWNVYEDLCEYTVRRFGDTAHEDRFGHFEREINYIVRTLPDNPDKLPKGRHPSATEFVDFMTLGYHESWMRRQRMAEAQNLMGQEQIVYRSLILAFATLPALKIIKIADYGSLARKGESYDSCCIRLFDDVLEPSFCSSTDKKEQQQLSRDFFEVFRALEAAPDNRIEELHVSSHPFEPRIWSPEYMHAAIENERAPLIVPADIFVLSARLSQSESNVFLKGLNQLKTLHLNVGSALEDTDSEDSSYKDFAQLLGANTPNLQCLTLVATKSVEEDDPFILARVLPRMVLPCLRYLELRHFDLHTEEFPDFLERHGSTLRELRLLECDFGPYGSNFHAGRDYLRLEGVEARSWSDLDLPEYLDRDGSVITEEMVETEVRLSEHERNAWLEGRRNSLRPFISIYNMPQMKFHLQDDWNTLPPPN